MDQKAPTKKNGWKISVQHWELDGVPVSILTNQLSQEFGQPSVESDTVEKWSYSPDILWNREIQIQVNRSTGEIQVIGYSSELGKRLSQVLILIAPVLFAPFPLYGVPVLEWWTQFLPRLPLNTDQYVILLPYLASMIYLGPIETQAKYDEVLAKTSLKTKEKSSKYFYIISSVAVIFYWTSLRTEIPGSVANGMILAIFALFLLLSYRDETSRTLQTQIPAVSLLWFIWPLFLLAGATLMQEPLGATTSQILIQAAATIIITLGVSLTILGLFGLLNISNSLYFSIQTSKIEPYRSKAPKYVITAFYTAANIIMLAGITLKLTIIHYTTTREYLFPEPLLRSLGLTEPISDSVTLLNTLFQSFPGTSTIYVLVFELMILAPLIIITGMWLHSLVDDTLVKYRVLKHSETLKNLEQNIEIRVIPTGPPIQTMTVLLGAKQYIIVNKKLVERTENRELEALITHEAYHLQNRDLLMNTFAGLTGIFFGGKNVLLALYDYPAKEREADKRAVEQTSKDELINGIQKSYELLSERNRHPGTQNPKRLSDRGPMRILQEGILKSVKRDIKRLYNWLLRTYAIFFGKVLLDKAHLGKEDRIQYINQLKNNK